MKRSYALALSGVALFLASSASTSAQVIRTGQQCVPAVANPSMYHNCRLQIVQGTEVCRCAIAPQALRERMDRLDRQSDRNELSTGSINGRGTNGPAIGVGGSSGPIENGGTVGVGGNAGTGSNVNTGGTVGVGGSVGNGGT
jgi:hypothetical protein